MVAVVREPLHGSTESQALSSVRSVDGAKENTVNYLSELLQVEHVLSAWLVDNQGRMVEGQAREDLWKDKPVGGSLLAGFGAAEMLGSSLWLGELQLTMMEYNSGIVLLSPFAADRVLAVVAENNVNLGMLRIQFRSVLEKLAEMESKEGGAA